MDLTAPLGQYVHGRFTDGTSTETFASLNPATGQPIATVRQASAADVTAAIESAQAGFETWSAMPGAQRGRILHAAVRLLRERNDELAALEVSDNGKPISEASVIDVATGADCLEFYAGLAASLHGSHVDFGSSWGYTRREPLGLCVGIGAWNYPIQIALWKSAPALACGNAMVFKPAELTPLTAAALAEVYTDAGLPDGVFNVVQGDARVGQALTSHPGIAKVSLTGEVGTGKLVMAQAATVLANVTLELGGKSPLIVFADADLDNAVTGALWANFFTQGEVCSNGTRVYVHEDIHDEFLRRLTERTKAMRIGDPTDPAIHVGALISAEHCEKVLGYIQRGIAEGARLVCGGGRPVGLDPKLAGGWFVEPTIFAGCRDDMTIVREEIFGPVMAVLTFRDEAEVLARANDTEYGLAAGVFTRDLARGHRMAARLQAGVVWLNTFNVTPPELPFGGYKQSGIGRENGMAVIEHYTQLKTVYVEMGDMDASY